MRGKIKLSVLPYYKHLCRRPVQIGGNKKVGWRAYVIWIMEKTKHNFRKKSKTIPLYNLYL